jgi:hypothetical protein
MGPSAPVDDTAGQDRGAPEERSPYSNRTGEEPSYDDSEKEACVSAKQEEGSKGKSAHGSNSRSGRVGSGVERSVSRLGQIT